MSLNIDSEHIFVLSRHSKILIISKLWIRIFLLNYVFHNTLPITHLEDKTYKLLHHIVLSGEMSHSN